MLFRMDHLILQSVILLFVLTGSGGVIKGRTDDCGPAFKGKCSCSIRQYDMKDQYVVNCTDQGFKETDVLENLPSQTQVLIFTGNYIPEMPWNVFGTLNTLENLRIVDMSNNHISEIKGKTYHHVQNVERLILNHNKLIISSDDAADVNHHHPRVLSNFVNLLELHLTDAFEDNTDAALADDLHDIFMNSNLTKLQKLHLEQNEILSFRDHKVFCDLKDLRDLHLGNNLLTGITFNISCLTHLRFLDLEENQIETLTSREVALLEKITSRPGRDQPLVVDLRGNPFACDCTSWDLYTWLKKTNVTVRRVEGLKCSSPRSMSGRSMIKLKITSCKESVPNNNTNTKGYKATMGLLIFFTLAFSCIIGLLIYTSRFQIRNRLSPVMETLTNKVQYTTIDNKDSGEGNI